ncbi:hypothetical protein E2P81_ATG10422 [Venturia nashicola]|nr:hypothetical protein E2P81_ATG10422 [Venturia nashicola]
MNHEEKVLDEQGLQTLRAACEANDDTLVRSLYIKPPYNRIINECLEDSNPNVSLLRCLLEDGGITEELTRKEIINSTDTLELLAEFGYDISLKGHLILQYLAHSQAIIDWMLDHGVDINQTDFRRTEDGFRLTGPNDTSLKVLNSVAARGDIELYDHLIARGADQSRSLALHSDMPTIK